MMSPSPQLLELDNQAQFRIIPSVYPPINFFEGLIDTADMETLWEIESLTNERLLEVTGNISLVPTEDRVNGPGSSVVMAAFTHIGKPSRFTDGSYGVYYASLTFETAIQETIYHRERFLAATNEEACEITMRAYKGRIIKPLHNIREAGFTHLHNPCDYTMSQLFGKELRETKSWGILYNSVRHTEGQCIAIFRPLAISIPQPISHLRYIWNGERMTEVFSPHSIWRNE